MKRLWTLLAIVVLLAGVVPAALAQGPTPEKPPQAPPTEVALGADPNPGIESLTGSFVVFDSSVGGATCFTPGMAQTFCFRAESFSPDWEYVYNLWEKFPTDWTVNNVYVQGTPWCDNGSWGSFSWSFQTAPYEVNIAHARYQGSGGAHCIAYYCFDVTAGSGTPDALESWFWDGDGYGSPPHWPCSNDGYAPPGFTCDEAVQPPASIPPCVLDPIMLTPPQIDAVGCPYQQQEHQFTVWNNAGYDTNVNLTYTILSGAGTCSGPAQVFVPNGGNLPITVELTPQGSPGDTVVCQVYAEDASNPNNSDASYINKDLVDAITYWEQIATEPDSGRMDNVVAAYNGYVWDITGYGANTNVRYYDPATNTWATLTPGGAVPPTNYARSGCTHGNTVYVYGDASGAFTGLRSYNMDTNTWTALTPGGTPPAQTGIWAPAWVHDPDTGYCYMTGGATTPGTGNLSTVYVYDPVGNAWLAPLPNFTTVRDFHAAWIFARPADSHKLLCVGGGNSASVGIASTQCYDFATATWNAENADMGPLPADWWGMGYSDKWHGGTDHQLWVMNGVRAGVITNETAFYDVNSGAWFPGGTTPSGTTYRTSATTLNNELYKIAGSTGSFNYSGLSDHHVQIICAPPCPPMAVQKEAPPTAQVGQVIRYTITIEADPLVSGMYMVDPLPAGVEYAGNLSWNIGNAWYDSGENAVHWEYLIQGTDTALPAVDATLGLPLPAIAPSAPSDALAAALAPAGGGTMMVLDDFNRADGPIGPNWTVHNGFCNVSSNAAVCGSTGRATFNGAPGDGNVAEVDVEAVGTSLQYAGLLLNYGAGNTNLFLKVQQQTGTGQFGHAACYTGNNGAAFGLGFFALSSPFTTAHMRATRVGNDVTIEFTNIDGGAQPPQTYVCSGAPAPEGTGIGIVGYAGIARMDNFGLPGGPQQAVVSFDATVTASPGEIILNEGWAGCGGDVYPFAAETEVIGGAFDAWKEAPAEVMSGETMRYTITVQAPAIVPGLYMSDTLPAGVEYAGNLTYSDGYAWYDDVDNAVYWTVPPLRTAVPGPQRPTFYYPSDVADRAGGAEPAAPAPEGPVTLWAGPEDILWDNGPMVTHPGQGYNGADASALQSAIGMNTYGFGNQYVYGYRMADDFTITDPAGWQIDTVTFFAYQTGTYGWPPASTITGLYFQIWDGPPWAGGNIIWGDLVTNRLVSSTWTGIYRVLDTNLLANDRPIMADVGAVGITLPPGTYWLDWLTDGSLSSGPWAPPITILGQTTTGDAYQYTTAWAPALDTGTSTQQGMPFIIEGTIPGGGGEQAMISFDVTVTAYCGETILNEGVAGDGATVVPFSAQTEVLGEPAIAVEPPALWVEVCPDYQSAVLLEVCNVGTCDLEWEIHEITPTLTLRGTPFVPVNVAGEGTNPGLTAASPSAKIAAVPAGPEDVLWDQPLSGVNQNAYVDQDFSDYPDYSSFLADDFTNADPWVIESIFVPGNGWNGFTPILNATALTWQIYADCAGVPCGDPSGGGNPPVWTLTLPPNDPQVVVTDGSGGMPSNVQLNLATPGILPPGTWWLIFYPTAPFSGFGQYGRQPADTTNGYTGQFINPGGGFGLGTDWQNWTILGATQQDMAFRIEGTIYVPYPDFPWLWEDPINGTVPPGECTGINVTFDATGMAPGDYRADLLILSNDPAQPEVTVPVTMTVLEAVSITDVDYGIDGLTVAFTSTVSGSEPIDYLWDFGDGVGSSTEPNPTYTYAEGGCYDVSLDVANACGQDSWTGQVCVEAPCEEPAGADFDWWPTSPLAGDTTYFTATLTGGTAPFTYTWAFGDGTYGSGEFPSHVYANAGEYTVLLTVTNACGEAYATHALVVQPVGPTYYYIYLPVIYKGFTAP